MRALSIRWRIMLWNTAAFAVVLCVFGGVVYYLLRQTHYDHVDAQLRKEWRQLTLASASSYASSSRQVQDWVNLVSQRPGFHAFAVAENGTIHAPDEGWEAYSPLLPAGNESATVQFDSQQTPELGHARRAWGTVDLAGEPYQVVLFASLHHVDEELMDVVKAIAFTIPPTLLIAAALSYWLARKALLPVEQLRCRTDEITAEHLDRRLPVVNPRDELGLLTHTINEMIDRLETSFREVQRFTADASHELRTPLAIIRSEAEIGSGENQELSAAQERFGSILEECNRLATMTDQLLTLCREDAGLETVDSQSFDLAALLQEAVDAVRPLAQSRQIHIATELPKAALIVGDSPRLRQVMYNLLDNAFKATPADGQVTLRLRPSNGSWQMEVSDTGLGIAQEHLDRIFDRFYRVEKNSSQNPGAGLGLSIVKSIVLAHGGQISVESEPGRGTTFRLTLTSSC